jgi:HSP20 family protein
LKHNSSITYTQINPKQLKMVNFFPSSRSKAAAITSLLLAMAASSNAYRTMYRPSFPSLAVRRSSPSALARQSFFPRDIGRMFYDVDELFDSMMGDIDNMFYDPSPLQRMSRPSYLLQGRPSGAVAVRPPPANTYSITQHEKQVKMVVTVPGANASDVKLDLDEENRTLRISGETNREHDGIFVRSRFDKSFTLDRGLDIAGVKAEMDNGVLTITAPRLEEVKDSVRRIDILDNSSSNEVASSAVEKEAEEVEDVATEVKAEAASEEDKEEVKPETDESVIDLDEAKAFP